MNGSAPQRRIGVFTSGRQDWGGLAPVAAAIEAAAGLDLTVFVSGAHLCDVSGRTDSVVRAAGSQCVDVPMGPAAGRGGLQVGPASLAGMAGSLAEAMARCPVDVMVVLGDRIETLTAAVMVVADRRFLAHIHGGDRAPGEFDDANRHAITKLSHVHFPATAASAERILRLGESVDRVHNVGSPVLDSIRADGMAGADEARAAVGLASGQPFVLLLQHPASLGDAGEAAAVEQVCQGVHQSGLAAVCVGPNSDPGRKALWEALRSFSSRRNWPILPTLERRIFLRLLHEATALVGNSSAGMVESAAVDAVVVNVGPRQTGREHSANVLDCPADHEAVARTLRRLRDEQALVGQLRSAECIYGDGRAGVRIARELAEMNLSDVRRTKLIEY